MTDAFTIPQASAQQPDYKAASHGRRLRTWRVSGSGPNTVTVAGLRTIQSRARAAGRNDPWAGAGLDKLDANGIGTGIMAKMVNGSPALQAAVKKVWSRWSQEADADGMLTFEGLQALAWHEWHEVGEVFARLRPRRASDGLTVPLQVQIIEAEQCPCDLYTVASNGNQVRAGVEFDRIGRRVAYWMYPAHPGDTITSIGDRNDLRRVPAEEIIHVYRPLRAGQIRGVPDIASAMVRMFNLESMDDAVLERVKVANLFAGWYVQESGAADPDNLTGDMQTDTDPDGTPLAGLEPGTMQELPPGVKPQFSDPPTPGQEYSEFLRSHLMAIAARYGVPYEVLTGDLRNVSDRALRLILNEFRRGIEMRQWLFFIPMFCQRIRTAFFDRATLAGALEIPNYAEQRADVVETLWVPQGWPYSHPVQDVDADVKAIRAGLQSRTATILAKGEDPEQVDAENAEDVRRASEHGLVYDTDPKKVSQAGLTQARPAGSTLPEGDSNDGD